MKVNGLRLGNNIEFECSSPSETFRVSGGKITGILEDFVYVNGVKVSSIRLKPIPLDNELLTWLGFTKDPYSPMTIRRAAKNGTFLKLTDSNPGSGSYFYYGLGCTAVVQSVHQLQNLFFVLTGDEIEYK